MLIGSGNLKGGTYSTYSLMVLLRCYFESYGLDEGSSNALGPINAPIIIHIRNRMDVFIGSYERTRPYNTLLKSKILDVSRLNTLVACLLLLGFLERCKRQYSSPSVFRSRLSDKWIPSTYLDVKRHVEGCFAIVESEVRSINSEYFGDVEC